MGRKAVEQARSGDFEAALVTAKEALSNTPGDKGLRLFAGLLHSRLAQLEQAAAEFRQALALAPDDPLVRAELARVLIASGQLDEAERLLETPGLPDREMLRLQAALAARRGDHERAAGLYRTLAGQDPRDFESLGNLGVSLLAMGDAAGAVSAIQRSLQLKPRQAKLLDKLAEAHSAAGSAEEALRALYDQGSADPAALIVAARLEDLEERPQKAVEALQRALEADPANAEALAALADLQERSNQIDALEATIERLNTHAPAAEKLPLLRARAAYRRGDMDRALELAEQAAPHVDPAARAQLIGQAHDRLGNPQKAFEAFAEMNRIDSLSVDAPGEKTERFLASMEERLAVLTPEWVADWSALDEGPDREPALLVGFPRSGTTLLDTMLMNDPGVAVSEENPMLTNLSKRVGSVERIAELDAREVARLRDSYFEEAERYVPESRGRLLLDKFPFGLSAGPLLYRLFPTAPIVFLSRHPFDVVLSCFMTRFRPTEIGSAFLTLEGTARLYDSMMRFWTRSRDLLPLRVHEARYESLVESPEAEMRGIAEFLGIEWSDELLDNRPAAKRREFIKTPSYSQVGQPIYRRAVERWKSYEEQLRPLTPILEPWIERLGYEIDD